MDHFPHLKNVFSHVGKVFKPGGLKLIAKI